MLENTFCHIPGITQQTEAHFWSMGIRFWDDFFSNHHELNLSNAKKQTIKNHLQASIEHLENDNPGYFASKLPSSLHWRLFPEFRYSVAYLDIETSGMNTGKNYITTIALYNGKTAHYYVRGQNMWEFRDDIQQYKLLITYNGKSFDVPFIERYMKFKLSHLVHIDLRYVLASLGYTGGLKKCEKRLGIHRQELDGLSGRFAVYLWDDYQRTGSEKSLETLLAYNIADVVNLETLMSISYNKKLFHTTPFHDEFKLDLPEAPEVPIKPDPFTIDRVMREHGLYEANPYLYK